MIIKWLNALNIFAVLLNWREYLSGMSFFLRDKKLKFCLIKHSKSLDNLFTLSLNPRTSCVSLSLVRKGTRHFTKYSGKLQKRTRKSFNSNGNIFCQNIYARTRLVLLSSIALLV